MNTISIVSVICLICGACAVPADKQWNAQPEWQEQGNQGHGNWQNEPLPVCEGKMPTIRKIIY